MAAPDERQTKSICGRHLHSVAGAIGCHHSAMAWKMSDPEIDCI
jgi:hypothetical protein